MTRLLRGGISEAELDPEEAIGREGADDETVTVHAVATTSRPSNEGKGSDCQWRYARSTFVRTRTKANPYFIVNDPIVFKQPFCKGG